MALTPDLVIDSITAPLTVERNATLNFSYVVKNVGGVSATQAFGTATALDHTPAYPVDRGGSVFGLAAGATATLSYSFNTRGLSDGEHTLWVRADDTGVVPEGDESNNLRSVTFSIVNTKPDFTVAMLAPDEPSVMEGEDLDFSYLVENLGGTASSTGSIFYAIDGQPSLSNRVGPIGGAFVEASGATLVSESINTEGLSVGQHTLWVSVDATKIRSENDETNNLKSVTFTVTERPKPDQIIESITGSSTVVQGGDLNFSYVLKDIGVGNTANSFGAITFGIDRVPTSSSYDYIVGAGTLPAGGSLTFDEVLHANLSVGEHTLWIKADGQGNVAESNENNNLKSFTFTVTAAPSNPDLSLISINGATSVEQGTALSISYVIKNVGTLAAAFSNAAYMIDQVADPTHYLSAPTINALAANATQSFNAVIDTSGLSVGTHTVWFAADVFGSLTEISESNNTGSFTFMVTQPVRPDLKVNGISAPVSVAQGLDFTFSYEIKNIGTAASGTNWAGIMVDHAVDESHYMAANAVGVLAADGTQTLTNSIDTSGLSVGTHTLYIAADYWGNMVGETNESNNALSVTFTVTDPDLIL